MLKEYLGKQILNLDEQSSIFCNVIKHWDLQKRTYNKEPFELVSNYSGVIQTESEKDITASFSFVQAGDIQIFANIGVFFLAVF